MKKIKINASREYNVVIDDGLIKQLGNEIIKVHKPCRVMLVSDKTVDSLYGDTARSSLIAFGFYVHNFIIEPGESAKSTDNLVMLWESLVKAELSRSDIIIALGGGVCGDLAGFAAATYMRGIEYIQVPTTLLAMVDSSVGGKTAVDLEHGKNLAGAFYQPSLVLCDPSVLSTLSKDIFSDGMAEVIKYGFINCPELITTLENDYKTEDIISICIDNKRAIVEADEFDNGKRQLLNFGHTFGHAVEHCSGFNISHGKAVAIGMALITKAAVDADLCPADVYKRLVGLLSVYDLPSETPFSLTELCLAALEDKKRRGNTITLVLPRKLGVCELYDMPTDSLLSFITSARGEQ